MILSNVGREHMFRRDGDFIPMQELLFQSAAGNNAAGKSDAIWKVPVQSLRIGAGGIVLEIVDKNPALVREEVYHLINKRIAGFLIDDVRGTPEPQMLATRNSRSISACSMTRSLRRATISCEI